MSETYTATATTTIDASRKTVWDGLTNPALVPEYSFGAEVETDWAVGSPIVFRGGWEGEPFEDKGEIKRFEPERVLEYAHWSPLSGKPDVPENYHTVTFELTEREAATELSITQDDNDTEAAREHSEQNTMLDTLTGLLAG